MSRDRAPCRKEINFKNIDHGVCLLLRSDIRLFLLEIDHFRSRSLDNVYFGNGNNGSRRTLLE